MTLNFHVRTVPMGQYAGIVAEWLGTYSIRPLASTLPTSDRNEAARRAESLKALLLLQAPIAPAGFVKIDGKWTDVGEDPPVGACIGHSPNCGCATCADARYSAAQADRQCAHPAGCKNLAREGSNYCGRCEF